MIETRLAPSPAASNGRDSQGRFTPNNTFGKGNPHAKRVQEVRSALMSAVTDEDVKAIVAKMVERAKNGDVAAAKEVLDRLVGRPASPVVIGEPEDAGAYDASHPSASIQALQDHIDRLLGVEPAASSDIAALEPSPPAALPPQRPRDRPERADDGRIGGAVMIRTRGF